MRFAFPRIFRRRLLVLTWMLPFVLGRPARAQPAPDPVIMLPPLTVAEQGTPLKWRYLEMPGLEILSVCDDAVTGDFAQRLHRLDDLVRAVLPDRYLAKMAVPETMILLDPKTGQTRSREVLTELAQKGGARIRFMPNLRVVDLDATAVFAVVQSNPTSFTYATERIAFLLERRVPHLPDWFIAGMLGFYAQLELLEREIEIQPALWVSAAESAAVRSDPDRPRTFLSMEELFTRHPAKGDATTELYHVWQTQCALFIRWALVENGGVYKEALWKFVDRLEKESPTEALFREHFGQGYADVRDQLSDYLYPAVLEKKRFTVPSTPRLRLRFRAATDSEVARIRGDWERMEIAFVRERSPTYVDKYVEQARRTLARATGHGEQDPRLLAVQGLTEVDAGNPATARPFLEAAVRANVVRPRAYYELAHLRYEALSKGRNREDKFNAAQTAEVMDPLLEGHRQESLAQIYALMINVLVRSEAPPTAEQLAVLHRGARDFPQLTELVIRVIYFHLTSGQPEAAAVLADLALNHATDPEAREQLKRLRAELAAMRK